MYLMMARSMVSTPQLSRHYVTAEVTAPPPMDLVRMESNLTLEGNVNGRKRSIYLAGVTVKCVSQGCVFHSTHITLRDACFPSVLYFSLCDLGMFSLHACDKRYHTKCIEKRLKQKLDISQLKRMNYVGPYCSLDGNIVLC